MSVTPLTSTPITDTTRYPAFATKAAFFSALIEAGAMKDEILREIIYRLSNTDTDNWTAGSTARHDD